MFNFSLCTHFITNNENAGPNRNVYNETMAGEFNGQHAVGLSTNMSVLVQIEMHTMRRWLERATTKMLWVYQPIYTYWFK